MDDETNVISFNIAKAEKTNDSGDWLPKDAMKKALEKIDEGDVTAIMILLQASTGEDFKFTASLDVTEEIAMLETWRYRIVKNLTE